MCELRCKQEPFSFMWYEVGFCEMSEKGRRKEGLNVMWKDFKMFGPSHCSVSWQGCRCWRRLALFAWPVPSFLRHSLTETWALVLMQVSDCLALFYCCYNLWNSTHKRFYMVSEALYSWRVTDFKGLVSPGLVIAHILVLMLAEQKCESAAESEL